MVAIPTLITDRLRLRPFSPRDAPVVEDLLATPDIAATTLNIPYPYPPGTATEWITGREAQAQGDLGVTWAVTLPDDTLMGAISLGLNERHRRGTIGYWLGKAYWNRGYMTEATRAVIEYGFSRLALYRIEAHCLPRNPASARVMEKAGMQYEGRLRGYIRKNGVNEDLLTYAVIRPDLMVVNR